MEKEIFSNSVDEILHRWEFNGCVCISKNGQIIYEGSNGWANYENKEPHTLDSKFLIASVTKQFTAACIMFLVEEGKIRLDDKLDIYVPEYTYSDRVTIRQMLNMMSGIPDMINGVIAEQLELEKGLSYRSEKENIIYEYNMMSRPFVLSEVLELVNDRELDFIPGTEIRYSNTNYSFLGFIIERISGMSLNDFMSSRICVEFAIMECIDKFII